MYMLIKQQYIPFKAVTHHLLAVFLNLRSNGTLQINILLLLLPFEGMVSAGPIYRPSAEAHIIRPLGTAVPDGLMFYP